MAATHSNYHVLKSYASYKNHKQNTGNHLYHTLNLFLTEVGKEMILCVYVCVFVYVWFEL